MDTSATLFRSFHRLRNRIAGTLHARARTHLGSDTPTILYRSYDSYLTPDISIACKDFLAERDAEVIGYRGNLLDLFEDSEFEHTQARSTPVFEQISNDAGDTRQGLYSGLAFLSFENRPVLAYCWRSDDDEYNLSVLAREEAHAKCFLDAFDAYQEEHRFLTVDILKKVSESLNSRIRTFFGEDDSPTIVRREFPEYQIANISILIKEFFESLGAEFTDATTGSYTSFDESDLLDLLQPAKISPRGSFEGIEQTPPRFDRVEVDSQSSRLGLHSGLVLFSFEDKPMYAFCRRTSDYEPKYKLSVVARDTDDAERLLQAFAEYENRRSIFRGRLLRPKLDYMNRIKEAEILEFSDVAWSDVVLPETLRERLQHDVLDYVSRADALQQNNIELKRGILFYGPPGTGKTFVCNLLASQLTGFTSILVAGSNLMLPEGVFRLARKLSPALIFFEDIDLIGSERDVNPLRTVLGSLLNELDGLPKSEQIIVVFTTNKLEVLEDALAQRPGRVDLLLQFPLPEASLRERLIELYRGNAEMDYADVQTIVNATAGATPAFLRELMKQSVFQSIQDGAVDDSGIAQVAKKHIDAAFARVEAQKSDRRAGRILGFHS